MPKRRTQVSTTGYRSLLDWSAEERARYWDEMDAERFRSRAPRDIWGDTLCFEEVHETDEQRCARLARHAQVLAELGVMP